MRAAPTAPLRFEPILKRLIWGGRRLESLLGKPLGSGSDYAESWEIADHGADCSRVADGPDAGRTLRDLVLEDAAGLLGPSLADRRQFPLLVKFLDAHQTLSVQVHPDDALADRLLGDNGKTEAWVILHADPGSVVYAGLKPGVDRPAFEAALASGGVEPLLHQIPARAGDCISIPAGTVHAIGAGVVLFEIQQSSDATFRVFDWDRRDARGQPRALHLVEALQAIDFSRGPVEPETPRVERHAWGVRERLLERCPLFALERLRLEAPAEVGRGDRFTVLAALEGMCMIESPAGTELVRPGDVRLLPAALGPVRAVPWDGPATLLLGDVPDEMGGGV